jgi:hypothetical protein
VPRSWRAPGLETKTAERKNATALAVIGGAWASEHDRREKICVLDLKRADRC